VASSLLRPPAPCVSDRRLPGLSSKNHRYGLWFSLPGNSARYSYDCASTLFAPSDIAPLPSAFSSSTSVRTSLRLFDVRLMRSSPTLRRAVNSNVRNLDSSLNPGCICQPSGVCYRETLFLHFLEDHHGATAGHLSNLKRAFLTRANVIVPGVLDRLIDIAAQGWQNTFVFLPQCFLAQKERQEFWMLFKLPGGPLRPFFPAIELPRKNLNCG
jgi:hypothetical protein